MATATFPVVAPASAGCLACPPAGTPAAAYPDMAPGHPATSGAVDAARPGSSPVASTAMDPVVGSQYCCSQEVTLKKVEKNVSLSDDDFTVVDAETGAVHFKMDAKFASMSQKRVLKDAQGQPVCCMNRQLMKIHKWILYAGDDFKQRLAVIRPKILTTKPKIYVMLHDGDKDPDYVVKGANILAKSFDVYKVEGDTERVVAQVKKESRFSSGSSFVKAAVMKKQSYFITAQPGTDLAFVTALCNCIDEIYHDNKQ